MKTCPLRWRPHPATVTSDETGLPMVGDGEGPQCLGASCRFFSEDDDSCRLEGSSANLDHWQHHLSDGEERWENMLLSLIELTERLESTIQRVEKWDRAHTRWEHRQKRQLSQDTAQHHNDRGVQLFHAGQLDQAHRYFQRAVELDPTFVEAHNNLGLVETERGNNKAATAQFRRAIELDPDLAASYTNLGYIYYLEECYVEAVAMYEEALDRAQDSSIAWTNLGNAHFKMQNLNRAREAWERAVALDADNRGAARNLEKFAQSAGL